MTEAHLSASLRAARRLVVTKQHLAGEAPARGSRESLLRVVSDLAYVQWDPVSIVAPSHVISLWSRIGDFDPAELDRLLWKEKKLFLTWTPIASVVPIEDYPLHASLMCRYPDSLSDSWGAQRERARKFLGSHAALRRTLLRELEDGPRTLSEFHSYVRQGRSADGWTPGSEVAVLLSYLLMTGDVMVVGHRGNQNIWGLSREFLPSGVDRTELTESDVDRLAAQRAIRALGTATPRDIHYYFVRGRYRHLKQTLKELQEDSLIRRVHVEGLQGRDERYVHEADVPLLESVDDGAWEPRLALIAPFDNLICGRDRTSRLFGFDYVHEQFLPKHRRKFGMYVLPILWGEGLAGRLDLQLDRDKGTLHVNSVHAETGAPRGNEFASDLKETIMRFARFLGAEDVTFTSRVPRAWKSALH